MSELKWYISAIGVTIIITTQRKRPIKKRLFLIDKSMWDIAK